MALKYIKNFFRPTRSFLYSLEHDEKYHVKCPGDDETYLDHVKCPVDDETYLDHVKCPANDETYLDHVKCPADDEKESVRKSKGITKGKA